MKCNYLGKLAVLLGMSVVSAPAAAQSISLNFSENSANQAFTGGEEIGPLATDSATWNNTASAGSTAAGTMSSLIDETGATTAASVTWSSSNLWFNNDGTADDEHRMAVGYLDDGDGGSGTAGDGIGVSVTFSNIPYANYRVYGLLASDQSGTNYDTLDFTVNGTEVFGAATMAPAYSNIDESLAQTGSFWSEADGAARGNYWAIDTSGSSLTITAPPRVGATRGSLSAVVIRDLSVPILDDALKAIINRDTGVVSLTNNTGATVNIAGIGLLSTDGAWTPAGWTSITDNYDNGGAVSGAGNHWIEFSQTIHDLSEGTLDTGALTQGETISMGAIWSQYYKESSDLTFEYLDAVSGETVRGLLEFTGNGGSPFSVGDFNGDATVDALDWPTVRDNFNSSHAGLAPAQSYQQGDLNGDALTNLDDLLDFKAAFEADQGPGSFAALTAVPEPATFGMIVGAAACGFSTIRRRSRPTKG